MTHIARTLRARLRLALFLFLIAAPALPAVAADPPAPAPVPSTALPSAPLARRSADLVALFNGMPHPEHLFAPAFLDHVSLAQVQALTGQLVRHHGRAVAIDRIEPASATRATAFVRLQRAVVRTELELEAAPPHRITGLLFAGAEVPDDSLATLAREVAALPGTTSLTVARLDGGDVPRLVLAHDSDRPLAIGSAFKLFILAELSRSVKAGERRWSDVVHLGRPSVIGSIAQSWPAGSPVTLHTLAALMISRSDNSATDTLIDILGRERVEAILPALGVKTPERLRPLLSTREAAALKAGKDPSLAARWTQGSEAERRALLAGPLASVPADSVDLERLLAAPNHIDSIEWFATTADLVRVMDWLRRNADPQALAIMAINAGVPPHLAADLSYIGYKGGSEAGVLNMTFLVQARDGGWHALSGTWNDPTKKLEDMRFELLMRRAVALLKSPSRSRERLSGVSSGIGELSADIASFGVEANEEFAGECDAHLHFAEALCD